MFRRNVRRSVFAALGIGSVFVVASPSVAYAAGNWYPANGTVFENGNWYESATVRYEGINNNTILLNLTKGACSGVDFRLLQDGNNSQIGSIVYYSYFATGTKTLATHVGKLYFHNDFKADVANVGCGDYTFQGSEQY